MKLNSTLTKIITIYFAGGLSWYVHDAAHDIATKIAKKPFNGNDRGDSLIFQKFIQSWVGYELVKVLNVFSLQPKIRTDLAVWSPDLFDTFTYLSNRTNNQHRDKATKMLDLLFDQTKHNSYWGTIGYSWLDGLLKKPWSGVQTPQVLGYSGLRVDEHLVRGSNS